MRLRRLRAAVGALAVLAVLSACTGTTQDPTQATTPTPQATASDIPGITATATPDTSEYTSTIAHVKGDSIKVSDTPGGPTTSTLKAEDVLTVPDQTPLVLLVKQVTEEGVEVFLPVRPNGTTGWVSPNDVNLYSTDLQLDVYHADHTLTVSEAGQIIATYPIATGQDDMPTPGGTYFIRELLAPPNPKGAYGPYAYGLSGYSPVLDNFNGGDAVIGIHGTDDPSSIGKDISHGCIRMNNADITQLVELWQLPLGTPVYIHE
ncbi:MAG: L,D-transpeptidase [Demequina sp.]|jgi:lipoprotein-anchoring transpeptidase ErfK/SrfK|nr:L,D-transpeptidase [Demequina sp.]